jgi:tRNA(Leu) C34 or U34 (ribose-2'-O)-methylase TrmL
MSIIHIEDVNDPRLEVFRLNERQLFPRDQRRDPAESGLFVAEGDLVVERAFAAGCKPRALLCAERYANQLGAVEVDVFTGDIELRREVTGLGVPLDALGIFERPSPKRLPTLLNNSRRVVALEAVDNPTNIGAVVRSAAGLGWDALALDWTSADPFARRALRVAMGTSFLLPHGRANSDQALSDELESADLTIVAMTPDPRATDIRDLATDTEFRSRRIAVLFGSERIGLSEQTLAKAHVRARIAMRPNVDSLNIANAASIALFALS